MEFLHIGPENFNVKNNTGDTPINILNDSIKKGKQVFALIYMDGCGPCNAARPEWTKIENVLKNDSLNDNKNILVVDIDKDVVDKIDNFGTEPKGFPTIRYISNEGKTIEDFEDSKLNDEFKTRTIDSFIEWIKLKSNEMQKGSTKTQKGGKRKRMTVGKRKRMTVGKWSRKYKLSINCKHPKGFSQRQYCKYSRKGVNK